MASSDFSSAAPSIFNGEGYHIWVVKIKTYLQAFDLWEAWGRLKEEFQGTERTRQQQLLNLRRDFENLKMKEEETVKQYSDRIMAVVNSIRLLGEQFSEARIVEKQRRASRLEEYQEGDFQAKTKPASSISAYKGKRTWRGKPKLDAARRRDQPCRHCKRPGHPEANCWFRPNVQCQYCKKMGHVEKPKAGARVAKEGGDHEEHVFAVSCPATKEKATKGWLIDSGCTNHMTPDVGIFKSKDRSFKTKLKVGNGYFIKVEGKGDVLISIPTGNKLVSNVLLVPEIDRNLLSIAQLLNNIKRVVLLGN
ncbi:uncharacterized protein LOC108488241 [Gossypium arboreum]|uniref:uncharacterized protein LOC108488241 n=1 Tax=Gossypium arboreum TaxID=29729 RepID=UPI0008193693|nr:uncharacterized protein LOC108488241 [Gossypium arboreum]